MMIRWTRRSFIARASAAVAGAMAYVAAGTIPRASAYDDLAGCNSVEEGSMTDSNCAALDPDPTGCIADEQCKVAWGPPVNGCGNTSCSGITYAPGNIVRANCHATDNECGTVQARVCVCDTGICSCHNCQMLY